MATNLTGDDAAGSDEAGDGLPGLMAALATFGLTAGLGLGSRSPLTWAARVIEEVGAPPCRWNGCRKQKSFGIVFKS